MENKISAPIKSTSFIQNLSGLSDSNSLQHQTLILDPYLSYHYIFFRFLTLLFDATKKQIFCRQGNHESSLVQTNYIDIVFLEVIAKRNKNKVLMDPLSNYIITKNKIQCRTIQKHKWLICPKQNFFLKNQSYDFHVLLGSFRFAKF